MQSGKGTADIPVSACLLALDPPSLFPTNYSNTLYPETHLIYLSLQQPHYNNPILSAKGYF